MSSKLTTAAVAAVGGLIAGAALSNPIAASAADNDPLKLGVGNTSTNTTFLTSTKHYDLSLGHGISAGTALVGDVAAVGDDSELEYKMSLGNTDANDGGLHIATTGDLPSLQVASKKYGIAAIFTGKAGNGTTAVLVNQYAKNGRGAAFNGGAAQIQLQPATGAHPKSGQRGDFFVDKDGRLWFCKGGTTWKQLA